MVPAASNKFRVLLIDDDEDDYLIVRRLIDKIPNSPFVITWQSSYQKAEQLIKKGGFDLYLVDYLLGEHSGLKLLESAKPHERPEPFIILTGAGDDHIEQTAMRLGASDYIVKGTFTTEILSRSMRYALQRKTAEEQRVQNLIALSKAKDEFISLASHQLRTPATGVKQYIGMALDGYAGVLTEPQQKMLQKAYESNERQLQIVSDLLNVARVDAGRVTLRPTEVDLVALVDDVLKEQQGKFEARQQTVAFTHQKPRMTTQVDKDTFRMVLENLIDNASKYTEADKHLAVKLYYGFETIVIDVVDQGVGISSEGVDRLFQKFVRLDNPLSTIVGGSGLGLYWVKQIIDLHEGAIKVMSKPGKGSTFRVRIPLK
jgi:two-component system sensor histidine kinase/response regulator